MDWRRLDLNLLKVLAVMLEERSVVRAADRLFVSPSAVSHALARLRRAFDDPLFVRTPQGMIATPRAQRLERPLSLLVSSLTGSSNADVFFDPRNTRRALRIASPGALDLTLIPALVDILRERAPQWSLTIQNFERRSYEVDLASGQVDFVFSVGGHTPTGIEVASLVLWEDELVAVVGPESSAYEAPGSLSTDRYLEQPQVYPVPWPVTQNYLDVELARKGRHRTFALSVPSYASVGPTLLVTDLIASMPDRTATAITRAYPQLRILRVTPPRRSDLSLLWSAAGQREPELSWARGIIQEAASCVPGWRSMYAGAADI